MPFPNTLTHLEKIWELWKSNALVKGKHTFISEWSTHLSFIKVIFEEILKLSNTTRVYKVLSKLQWSKFKYVRGVGKRRVLVAEWWLLHSLSGFTSLKWKPIYVKSTCCLTDINPFYFIFTQTYEIDTIIIVTFCLGETKAQSVFK